MPATLGRGRRWLPGIETLLTYRREYLPGDVSAGFVLVALMVPVGLAYAQVAGLPPIYGLYASLVPLIAYWLTGPSPVLVYGPDSSIAPLVAVAVLPLAAGDTATAVATAGLLAVMVGAMSLAAGALRLGRLTDLISRPIRYGYLNGIAIVVIVSQLPRLLGFSVDGDAIWERAGAIVAGFAQTNVWALATGLGALAVIAGFDRLGPRFPGMLVGVVASIAASVALDLPAHGVAVVGAIPQGLPAFTWPATVPLDRTMWMAALGITLVSIADTSVLSRSLAVRRREDIDPGREILALGVVNLATGLFSGFPVSSSSSRTPAAEASGARTQVAGLVAAAGIALVLVVGTGLFAELPQPALAAVVIAAVGKLFGPKQLRVLLRADRSEFWLAIAALLGVVLLGVLEGIGLAIALSILDFVRRGWQPRTAVLGRVDQLKGYHDTQRHPEANLVPGLVIVRFDAPLFFANANLFRERVRGAIEDAPYDVRRVMIAAEPITEIDSTAAEVLCEMADELGDAGVEWTFAEMKGPVRDKLDRFGLVERIGRDRFFPTVGSGVTDYLRTQNVDYSDWEDDESGA
ncbi:MAG: SulP family inorganic anion transporter [Coriobacteriia bacterium]|nr:SulP family inorganic anion transporter [Coriobacteriia bacterium]